MKVNFEITNCGELNDKAAFIESLTMLLEKAKESNFVDIMGGFYVSNDNLNVMCNYIGDGKGIEKMTDHIIDDCSVLLHSDCYGWVIIRVYVDNFGEYQTEVLSATSQEVLETYEGDEFEVADCDSLGFDFKTAKAMLDGEEIAD